jgi:hypothetical protein
MDITEGESAQERAQAEGFVKKYFDANPLPDLELPSWEFNPNTQMSLTRLDERAETMTTFLGQEILTVFGLPTIALKDMPKNTIIMIGRGEDDELYGAVLKNIEFKKEKNSNGNS